jgi:hypothetical protein
MNFKRITSKTYFYPNWRNRFKILLGLPISIETDYVVTNTQMQSCFEFSVGNDVVMTVIGEPVAAKNDAVDTVPCIVWCDILEVDL